MALYQLVSLAPHVSGKDRQKSIYSINMSINSAERFVFSLIYHNTIFHTKTESTFRMKQLDSSLLVRVHRTIKVTKKHSK